MPAQLDVLVHPQCQSHNSEQPGMYGIYNKGIASTEFRVGA